MIHQLIGATQILMSPYCVSFIAFLPLARAILTILIDSYHSHCTHKIMLQFTEIRLREVEQFSPGCRDSVINYAISLIKIK